MHTNTFFNNYALSYTARMNENVHASAISEYVSVKEAAKLLGLSPRTVYDYIEEGRLPSTRFADVIAIAKEDIKRFKREPSGRPRKNTPLWRISSGDNEQLMTFILVHVRPGKHEALMRKLEVIRKKKQHLFPGTTLRYIAESNEPTEQIMLVFVWRGTVMPDEAVRQEALKEFRQALDDVVDWTTVEYHDGTVLIHT